MRPKGDQIKCLQSVIVENFSREDFSYLLHTQLELVLEEIVPTATGFSYQVYLLLVYLAKKQQLTALIDAVLADRPKQIDIQETLSSLRRDLEKSALPLASLSLLRNPRVFISYSHESEAHRQWVLELSKRLCLDGFETVIDCQVQGVPAQGWSRWTENQIDWAEFVLVVCTETYRQPPRAEEVPGLGNGGDWEGAVISEELYEEKSRATKFVSVLRARGDDKYIPRTLQACPSYFPSEESSYAELKNFLTGAAGFDPAQVSPAHNRVRHNNSPGPTKSGKASAAIVAPVDLSTHVAPGGTMPIDDLLYIERFTDQIALSAAKKLGETLVIKGPRQFGKSSLLYRYLDRCRQSGKQIVYLDLATFEEGAITSYTRFLSNLAILLANRLRSALPGAKLRNQQEFGSYIETKLLPSLSGRVVFAFDETERILRQSYAADFFSMLRSWHNGRSDPANAWHNLGLALVSSSEPKLFIRDPMRSPFNVGERLELATFTLPEISILNLRYQAGLSEMQCARLHRLLGGHPYLTQDAYYRLCGPARMVFEDLVADSAKDDGPFGAHLRATFSNLQATDGLLPALRTLIKGGKLENDEQYYRLAGAGLVCKKGKSTVPTNEIYRDFFGTL